MNASWGPRLVVNDTDFEKYKRTMTSETEVQNVQVFNIVDKDQLAKASAIRTQNWDEGNWVVWWGLLHNV